MRLFDRLRENRALARAEEAAQEGRLDAAIEMIETVLAREPNQPEALHLLGQLRFHRDDLDAAEAIYERLVAIDDADEAARESLRQVHLRRAFDARELGDVETAAARFKQAIELKPEDAFAYYNLGAAYSDFPEQYATQAMAAWRKAVELRPDYLEAHFDLGRVYLYNERYEEALPHFEAILERRQDWPAPYYCAAVVFVKRGDFERAIEYVKAAIMINVGWARTAAEDEHLAPLRGHPEFDALLEADAMVSAEELSRNMFTREDLLRDIEALREEESGSSATDGGTFDDEPDSADPDGARS